MSRINELSFGDLDTVYYHLNQGVDITHDELLAAMCNLALRMKGMQETLETIKETNA